jgi:hypothetical protein
VLGRLLLAKQQGKTFMNSIIQKQEDTIAQLQLAIEHYLEEGNLELAFTYSELFKINCEAYKALVSSTEIKEEKPVFKFGKQAAQRNTTLQTHLNKAEKLQLDYEEQMRSQYAQQQGQQQVQQREAVRVFQPVVSQYSYGDGQDNPKIRANDNYGNWGGNGEPNEIVTPPQQLINSSRRAYSDGVAINEEDNLWGDDPRRSLNRG